MISSSCITLNAISMLLLLLPPSRFSRVRLCVTPWTAAYQASPSMGFSRDGGAWSAAIYGVAQCQMRLK